VWVLILWIHLLAVVTWIGGLVFQLLVVVPTLRRAVSTLEQVRLDLSFEARFRVVLWPAIGLVLFTGLANVVHVLYTTSLAGGHVPPAFVRVLAIKLLLVVGMLVLQTVQRFVVQPRRMAWLGRLSPTVQEVPLALRQLQRFALVLRLLILGMAVVVMLLALLLRG
jgi:uncharacterized membrane protein